MPIHNLTLTVERERLGLLEHFYLRVGVGSDRLFNALQVARNEGQRFDPRHQRDFGGFHDVEPNRIPV